MGNINGINNFNKHKHLQEKLCKTIKEYPHMLKIDNIYTIKNGETLWSELWSKSYSVKITNIDTIYVTFTIINPSDYDVESGNFSVPIKKFHSEIVF